MLPRSSFGKLFADRVSGMALGLPVAIALLAETTGAPAAGGDRSRAATSFSAPGYGPAVPAAKKASPASPDEGCPAAQSKPDTREIVICAQRPHGYRLNPDVMEARREMRTGGRPTSPHQTFKPNDCATIGPMGCRGGPMIDMFSAAAILAAMAERLSRGQPVGDMFKTAPALTEYDLYLQAKKEREAREAEAAAKAAKAKAAAAPAASAQPTPAGK